MLLDLAQQFLEQLIAFGFVSDLASDVSSSAEFVLVVETSRPGLSLIVVIHVSGSLLRHGCTDLQ